jgi:hypothetical protein
VADTAAPAITRHSRPASIATGSISASCGLMIRQPSTSPARKLAPALEQQQSAEKQRGGDEPVLADRGNGNHRRKGQRQPARLRRKAAGDHRVDRHRHQ